MIHREYGQTLSEYVLAGGLIAVVAIGVSVAFADQLEALLPDTIRRIFEGDGQTTGAQAVSPKEDEDPSKKAQPSQQTYAVRTVSVPAQAEGLGKVNVQLDSGLVISLEHYPVNRSETVETAGANGTTEILLANLDGLIEELEAAGEISPEDANALKELSNRGHTLAEAEAMLENLYDSANGDYATFTNTEMVVDGKTYDSHHLKMAVGWGNDIHTQDLLKVNNSVEGGGSGELLRAFIEQYQTVEKNGALSDPVVHNIVKSLSEEITMLAEGVNASVNMLNKDKGAFADRSDGQYIKDYINRASDTTHKNSVGLCATGGGKDTGVHCP